MSWESVHFCSLTFKKILSHGREVFDTILVYMDIDILSSHLWDVIHVYVVGFFGVAIVKLHCLFVLKFSQGAGTDEHALIEILVTRSNEEIHAMNAAYQEGEFDTSNGFQTTF